MKTLRNEKILFTGLTGQIGLPIALELAKNNEVWGLARFRDEAVQRRVESAGITTRTVDLANPDFRKLPDDFTYVIHFGVFQGPELDFDYAVRVNAEGTTLLMNHCRKARGFFSMSSQVVYALPKDPHHPVKETDPLGGSGPTPWAPTYFVSKMTQEAAARSAARLLNLPTTIARMAVSYSASGTGGLPAMQFEMMLAGQPIPLVADRPSPCSPIHQDDINAQIAGLLAAASVPAVIVNWGGDDPVDVETYCNYMAEIAGLKPKYERTSNAIYHTVLDSTRRRELVGDCQVKWREGMRRMIAERHPELKLKA